MRRLACCLCALPLVVLPVLAQKDKPSALNKTAAAAAPKPDAAVDYKDEALVFEHYDTTIRMRADGTGERTDHVVVRVQSEGAVRSFGVLSVSYASATSTGAVEHVVVHKADGTTVTTPEADTMEVTPTVTREAPLYSDLKEKQLPVRSLAVGDRLEYDLHTTYTKAEAPGQFWGAERILFPAVTLQRVFTLAVPAKKYVQVWSPHHPSTQSTEGELTTYRWTTSQLKPTPKAKADGDDDDTDTSDKDPDEDAQGRKLPSIAWTTFHNWAEVGDWYRGIALDRAQPNDALRARAAELTKDAKTPEEQVRLLYAFVAGRMRYVGIDLGAGRFQPHAAETVLSNQYGDCKDKDTLLEALLRAKGFTTAPALIGAGITPVPDVPAPSVFNHVITTVALPGGTVWLDSTTEVAPYRLLNPSIRDQEALVVPDKAPASLQKTPALPPYAFTSRFEGEGEYKDDGSMKAHMKMTVRDDTEVLVRAVARTLAPAEWDKASQYLSYQMGFGGTTSNTRFITGDLAQPVECTYDYTRKKYGDADSHQIVPLFPALGLPSNATATEEPLHDLDIGAPRTEVAVSRIRIPDGWHPDLPDAQHLKTPWVAYEKTYRFKMARWLQSVP